MPLSVFPGMCEGRWNETKEDKGGWKVSVTAFSACYFVRGLTD